MAEISVIVSAYNTEQYIHRCLDSILAQTFQNYEVILIDDGSTDSSGEICDEYALKDIRIKVFHQENQGLAKARNFALDWIFDNSDSKYISFVDSDDWIHPSYLEKLLFAITTFDAPIGQCSYIKTDAEIPFFDNIDAENNLYLVSPEEQYSKWFSAYFCGKLFIKECFSDLRFPAGKLFEDVLIWHKLLFSIDKLVIIDENLYYYYQRQDNITNGTWTTAKLSQIDAWEEQLEFALEHGNKGVLQTALTRYCWVYKHQCEEIRDSNLISDKEKKKHYSKLIKRFRHVLLQNWEELKAMGVLFQYTSWAFPRMDKLYWTLRGICGKIKRRGQY